MKRLFLLCSFLAAIFFSKADPISFTSVTPSENSEITSWNFTLKFNIEDALASVSDPTIKYGLGWQGSNTYNTKLYQGDTSGELLGTCMNTTFSGKSEGFDSNPERNEVSFSFDSSIPIVKGQIYTVAVHNRFCLYKEGATTVLSGSYLDYRNSPLLLTFKGGDNGKLQFILDSSSIKENESYEYINQVSYFFGHPVTIDNNKVVSILENGIVKGASSSFSLNDDATILTAIFENPVYLDFSHKYSVILPEGTASHISDASLKNSEKIYNINGTNKYVYDIKSSSLNYDESGFPIEFIAHYDLPESKTFTPSNTSLSGIQDMLYLYQISDGIESEVSRFKGSRNSYSILWTIDNVMWNPSTNYILKTSDDYIIFDSYSGEYLKECSVQITSSKFVTPTIEEINLPKIELNGIAKLGDYVDASVPDFVDGGSYDYINTIELGKKEYVYNGKKYNPVLNWGNQESAFIYDVTSGQRVLVKEFPIRLVGKETKYEIFSIYQLNVASALYLGHKYEIVIPSGTFRIASQSFSNYVTNDEIVFNVNGAAVSEFKVVGCSVSDNEEMSQLPPAVVWQLEGAYSLASANAKAKGVYSGAALGNSELPIVIRHDGIYTYVYAYESNYDGSARNMRNGVFFTITIPEGTIIYPGDESIKNPELKVTIKGIDPKSNEPEFVNTTVTLADEETNEAHSFIVETIKGYPAKIKMLPGENWNVADVAHNGNSLTAVDGVYASEPLTEDSKFIATLAFNKPMQFDQTTGIYSVEDTNIKVFTENNQIVVSGLTQPTNIAVYSVGGILVKQMTTEAAYDMVRISAEPNEIYVVVINGQAAKVRL